MAMKSALRATCTWIWILTAGALVACDSSGNGTGDAQPIREDWQWVVKDLDFPTDTVTDLIIGDTATATPFRNRGDIDVWVDGPPGKISIRMRRFAFSQQDIDALDLWAYSTSKQPPPNPDELPPDQDPNNCRNGWSKDCKIFVYYRGQSQPIRAGADLQVILPNDYRGRLTLKTEDITDDDRYLRRGKIRVRNARGSVTANVESGTIEVKMAPDTMVAPLCGSTYNQTKDWNDECAEAVDDEGNPIPWIATDTTICKCGIGTYGSLSLISSETGAANITVDLPQGLWATARLKNSQDGLTPTSNPTCVAEIEGFAQSALSDEERDPGRPWEWRATLFYPGAPATKGSGFGVVLDSGACARVREHLGPDDFGKSPTDFERGNLKVCSGCLTLPDPPT